MECVENESESFKFSNDCHSQQAWSGYTLILPAVSVGNVGQLAVDILLSNLTDTKKICSIYDHCVVPVVGKDPFGDGICTSLELFQSEEAKVIILQQRAPFVKGRIPAFRRKLLSWIKKCDFSAVLMLSSVSSHVRKDKEIASPLPCFLTSTLDLKEEMREKYGWAEYTIKRNDQIDEYHLPGAGIVKSMLQDCEKNNIPLLTLLIFCHPGNNTREAAQLVESLNTYQKSLNLTDRLKIPLSLRKPVRLDADYIF